MAGAICLVRPPYLIIPYLAVEIALIWLARSPRSLWRRENFAAGGAFLGLGLALHLLHPAYLSSVVPDALAYYTALGNQDLSQLWTSKGVLIPCLAPFALLFFIKQRSAADALRFVLASAALGFALVFLLHGKGWAYQLMPIIALGAFAALVGIFAPNPRLVLWVVTAPLPAWLLFVAWQASQSMARPDPLVVDISELLKVPGRPAVVYGLAPESYPLFSAIVLADARWSAGDPHLWRLDGYYRGLEPAPDKGSFVAPEKAKAEELAIRQDLIERFLASEADFLVVSQPDAPSILGGTGFDYLEYLMTDLAFAERFARFHEVGQLGQYRFYARHTSP